MRLTSLRILGLPLAGVVLVMLLAGRSGAFAEHDDDHFRPGNLVLSRSVYTGDLTTVSVGQILPPGCVPGTVAIPLLAGGTTPVTVTCSTATADGTYPTVFDNDTVDGSFGVTSPIVLDQLTVTQIGDRIGERTGRRVSVTSIVDPDIIGGIVLRVGNSILDASIRNRLEQLRKQVARG